MSRRSAWGVRAGPEVQRRRSSVAGSCGSCLRGFRALQQDEGGLLDHLPDNGPSRRRHPTDVHGRSKRAELGVVARLTGIAVAYIRRRSRRRGRPSRRWLARRGSRGVIDLCAADNEGPPPGCRAVGRNKVDGMRHQPCQILACPTISRTGRALGAVLARSPPMSSRTASPVAARAWTSVHRQRSTTEWSRSAGSTGHPRR